MATIFPFEPNWRSAVDVSREYKTEIITSRNLTEQRKALRQEPRRRFEFDVQTTGVRSEDAWAFFAERIQDAFVMPDFTRVAPLSALAAKNTNTLTIPGASSIPWIQVGKDLMVGSTSRKTLPMMSAKAEVSDDWKYKVEPSGSVEDYSGAAYDDSGWDVAPGGFGEAYDSDMPPAGTYVDSGAPGKAIWVRFTLPSGPGDEGFLLTLWHDDTPELWVDGNPVDLPAQGSIASGEYFKSRVYVPASGTNQVVAYKVTEAPDVPSGSKIYAGVGYESTIPDTEVVRVLSVSGDSVVVSGVVLDRPAGTLVRPPVYGRMEQGLQGSFETVTTGSWPVVFVEDPNEQYRETYVSPPDETWFDGREVWLRKPNWLEPAKPGVQGHLETLMWDRGLFSHRNGQTFNLRLWEASYRNLNRFAAEGLIQFYHRLRGRRFEFWMPTFRKDLIPAGDAFSGNSILLVEGVGAFYRNKAEGNDNRIAVFYKDGSVEFHKIESVSLAGGNTSITLRDEIGVSITGSSLDRISLMPLWRMASDTLSTQHPVSGVSDATIALQQLRIDEGHDGHYPIESFSMPGTATFDIRGYDFDLTTTDTLGLVSIVWERAGSLISSGGPAEFTLSARVRLGTTSGGSELGDITVSQAGDGSVTLDNSVDIPRGTNYVRVTFTTSAVSPGDTTFSPDIQQTVQFRGRP